MGFFAGIECDKCGNRIAWSHVGKTYIAKWSRDKGWSVSRKEGRDICLCPDCRKRREKPAKEEG